MSPRRAGSAQREPGGRSRRLQLWSPSCARGSRRARPPNQPRRHGACTRLGAAALLLARGKPRAAFDLSHTRRSVNTTRRFFIRASRALRVVTSRTRARRPREPRRRREPPDPGPSRRVHGSTRRAASEPATRARFRDTLSLLVLRCLAALLVILAALPASASATTTSTGETALRGFDLSSRLASGSESD